MFKVGAVLLVCLFAVVSSAPIFWGGPKHPTGESESHEIEYEEAEADNQASEANTYPSHHHHFNNEAEEVKLFEPISKENEYDYKSGFKETSLFKPEQTESDAGYNNAHENGSSGVHVNFNSYPKETSQFGDSVREQNSQYNTDMELLQIGQVSQVTTDHSLDSDDSSGRIPTGNPLEYYSDLKGSPVFNQNPTINNEDYNSNYKETLHFGHGTNSNQGLYDSHTQDMPQFGKRPTGNNLQYNSGPNELSSFEEDSSEHNIDYSPGSKIRPQVGQSSTGNGYSNHGHYESKDTPQFGKRPTVNLDNNFGPNELSFFDQDSTEHDVDYSPDSKGRPQFGQTSTGNNEHYSSHSNDFQHDISNENNNPHSTYNTKLKDMFKFVTDMKVNTNSFGNHDFTETKDPSQSINSDSKETSSVDHAPIEYDFSDYTKHKEASPIASTSIENEDSSKSQDSTKIEPVPTINPHHNITNTVKVYSFAEIVRNTAKKLGLGRLFGGSEHIIIHVPYHVHTDHIHHHHVKSVPIWKPYPVVKHVPIYNEVQVPVVKEVGVPYPVHVPVHHVHQEAIHHVQEVPIHHHEDIHASIW